MDTNGFSRSQMSSRKSLSHTHSLIQRHNREAQLTCARVVCRGVSVANTATKCNFYKACECDKK